MSKQRPSLFVTIKERPLVFIVSGIAALVQGVKRPTQSRGGPSSSAWILLEDHLRIRELNSTLLQRYARVLWLAGGAITLIVTVDRNIGE